MSGDFGGAGRLMRVENMAFITEAGGRQRHHPAQLAAAEDADGGPWWKAHSGFSGTASVCFARQSASRAASALSVLASIAAASSAALTAPALPIARVPTGIPAGIWTIESRLSKPFSALLSMGTPSTGSSVI